MKITKIPGLGRFGIYIDDVDFDHLSDDEWMEIGRLHLDSLVTIVKNTKLSPSDYVKWMRKWGSSRDLAEYRVTKKYGAWMSVLFAQVDSADSTIDLDDANYIRNVRNMVEWDERGRPTEILRVSGQRDQAGNPLGMFAEGELLWHSNESGNICFTPAVSLLAYENVVGSSTGFTTTVDWYESQTESFRSELNDMIVVHKFTPGRINPGLREEQDRVMYRNMCPVDGVEIPLVRRSPGGHTGVHYSQNTIDYIKGMSHCESQIIFQLIENSILSKDNVYDHWYQNNGDLCLFDNSITQHRRLGDIKNRIAFRIQYDYETILDKPYQPYLQEPFQSQYITEIADVVKTMNKTRFLLPT